jgi:predicted MPP superfamily phosphohydrolase
MSIFHFLVPVYLALALLVGWRLWRLAAGTGLRPWVGGAYALLALLFPLADRAAHGGGTGFLPAWLQSLTLYVPPYLLNVLLLLVPTDLLVGLAGRARLVAPAIMAAPALARTRLAVVLGVPVCIVAWGADAYSHLTVTPYAIAIPRRQATVTRLRLAVASDFHLGSRTRPGFLASFVDQINDLDVDLLLLPGDVVEGGRSGPATEALATPLRGLQTRYGVFAALGNHEGYGGVPRAFFQRAGIVVLADSVATVPGVCHLVGRRDGHGARRASLAALLSQTDALLPTFVLDHRPVDLALVAAENVDLQVSGHTHHGQLFPLNLITGWLYDLSWGQRQLGRTHFVVTSGTQGWGPPVRTVGKSEIVVIDVRLVASPEATVVGYREPADGAICPSVVVP